MNFVYLVTTIDEMTGENHEILAAFSTKDKAENYYYKKEEQQKEYSCEYRIETVAFDVE